MAARRGRAQHSHDVLGIGASLNFKHAAQPHFNRGDAVNGAFHGIIEHHAPPEPQRPVPFRRKAARVGTFFEVIGRNPRHPHRLRRRINRAQRRQRNQKQPLPLRRPTIQPFKPQSQLRQSHPALAHIFACAVGVAGFAGLLAF